MVWFVTLLDWHMLAGWDREAELLMQASFVEETPMEPSSKTPGSTV